MSLTFPKVPFPGPGPANPTITYGGNTYTFDAGLLTQRVGDWVNGVVTDRWRLYDYEHAHLITDQEAELLGIAPEYLVVTSNILGLAEADSYLADTVLKNLGSAIVATLLPAVAAAQLKLSVDTADLAAANTARTNLAADQAASAAAAAALAANPTSTSLQAAATAATNKVTQDNALIATIPALQTLVSTTDPAAIAAVQAAITAIETQFA
jgi:hypothetical protein